VHPPIGLRYVAALAREVRINQATIALKESQGFARWFPVLISVGGYGLEIVFLGLAQKDLPMSLNTSTWPGLGQQSSL